MQTKYLTPFKNDPVHVCDVCGCVIDPIMVCTKCGKELCYRHIEGDNVHISCGGTAITHCFVQRSKYPMHVRIIDRLEKGTPPYTIKISTLKPDGSMVDDTIQTDDDHYMFVFDQIGKYEFDIVATDRADELCEGERSVHIKAIVVVSEPEG